MTDWNAIRKKRAKARRMRQNHNRLRHWTGGHVEGWAAVRTYYAALKAT